MEDYKANEQVDELGDFAVLPVPAEQRRSFLSIFWTNAGYTINISGMFTGAVLAGFLSLKQVFIVMVIATAILALFSSTIGAIGAKYGLSSTVLSRQSFGRYGSWLIGIVLAITLGIGWFSVILSFFADTVAVLFPNTFLTTKVVACIWGGLLMILTAAYGFRGLLALSYIAVPMMLILFSFGTTAILFASHLSFAELFLQAPQGSGTLGVGITMAVGSTAAGALGMADITRYAKNPTQAAVSGSLGYLLGSFFCKFTGAIMVVASRISLSSAGTSENIIQAMASLGLGAGALALLLFAQWTTNDNNLYSGSLGLANIFKVKKPLSCLIMGSIGIVIAIIGIQNIFKPFLVMLGLVVPPVAGVILSHYFIVQPIIKKEYALRMGETLPKVDLVAVFVTIAAAVISYFWVTAIPGTLMSIAIAFLLYALFVLVFEKVDIKYRLGEYSITKTGF